MMELLIKCSGGLGVLLGLIIWVIHDKWLDHKMQRDNRIKMKLVHEEIERLRR